MAIIKRLIQIKRIKANCGCNNEKHNKNIEYMCQSLKSRLLNNFIRKEKGSIKFELALNRMIEILHLK